MAVSVAAEEFKLLESDNAHFTKFAFSLLLEIDAKSDIFHQFLQFERADENLEFRRAVFDMKKIAQQDKSKLTKSARAIWEGFCKEDAPKCINIPDAMRHKIEKNVKENKFDLGMFDVAVREVELMLVQGPFPRFGNKICDIVQGSWDKITKTLDASEVGKILFMNWFMRDPAVMPMFKRDMAKHGQMLVQMIETAVGLLTDLKSLVPKLAKVGLRHGNYGAQASHFASLQDALLVTLEELLAKEYTVEIETAWKTIFQMMASVMNAAIAHAHETISNSSNSEKNARMHTEMESLLEILHNSPDLFEAFELYYNPEDVKFWGEILDFQKQENHGSTDNTILGKAKSMYDKYYLESSVDKVKLSSSTKEQVESRLQKATTGPEVYSLFEDTSEKLNSRLERRPFPIFKENVGQVVQNSWDELSEKMSKEKIGKILFMNFFQLHPDAMKLFSLDVAKHGAMLAGIMDVSVRSLTNVKQMIRNLNVLGSRHVKYGVKPEWFPDFGNALIQTFKDCLKEKFTSDMETSWRQMFLFISSAMLIGYHKRVEEQTETESTGSGSSGGKSSRESHKSNSKNIRIELSGTPGSSRNIASPKHDGSPLVYQDVPNIVGKKTKSPKGEKCSVS